MSIRELCNVDVVCCDVRATIAEVAGLMRENHVGDVVVVDMSSDGRIPVGIVTDRDIVIEAVAPQVDLELLTAGDIMTTPVMTINEGASLGEALELMESVKARRCTWCCWRPFSCCCFGSAANVTSWWGRPSRDAVGRTSSG